VLGELRKVLSMRSMAGGGAFHRLLSRHPTGVLGSPRVRVSVLRRVFRRLRYDNLRSAVKILRGHQREETKRFIAFRSHWSFETEFCNRARGNEKGGVEGEVGTSGAIIWCRSRRQSVCNPFVGLWLLYMYFHIRGPCMLFNLRFQADSIPPRGTSDQFVHHPLFLLDRHSRKISPFA
jgi:hypothetical protein